MNFDQMMETWKSQDEAPLYGVNRDLLQLVLQHEQADLQRSLRWEQWGTYGGSAVMVAFSAFFLWAFIYNRGPLWGAAATAVATAAAAAGGLSLWFSRRRQARRERAFGRSLQEEIRRNLSSLDYQLSRRGSTERILLSAAPLMLAVVICFFFSWLVNESSRGWWQAGVALAIAAALLARASAESWRTNRELLPRRKRLSELLASLDASE